MPYSIVPKTITKEIPAEKILVKVSLTVPQIEGTIKKSTLHRMNAFYEKVWKHTLRYAETTLCRSARRTQDQCLQSGEIFFPLELHLHYEVTEQNDSILSLYYDISESTADHPGITVRYADTWDLKDGYPVDVSFLRKHKKALLRECARQRGGDKRDLRKFYHPQQVYFSPEGANIFYQHCTIAPAEQGIVAFTVRGLFTPKYPSSCP